MSFDIERAKRYLSDTSVDVVDKNRTSGFSQISRKGLYSVGNFHLPVDSSEARQCAAIRGLIDDYSNRKSVERPLSIAVFGPPGSGKSFGVKEIVKHAEKYEKPVTINLAQVTDEEELSKALDDAFGGRGSDGIPAIFFDEFDSERLRWLKWFLAPMQDYAGW